MILGVVLGPIAETNLSRSLATNSDLTMFFTRPWAMFFFILGLFSLFFPWYQAWRGKFLWAAFYMPLLSFALSLPLILMGGWFRPALGVVVIVLGGWSIRKQLQRGYIHAPTPAHGTVTDAIVGPCRT